MIRNIFRLIDKVYRKFYRWYCLIHNKCMLYINCVNYGDNLSIRGPIFIRGGNISIGNNVIINSNMESNPIGGDTQTIMNTYSTGKILIGNNVGMSNCTLCAYDQIIIEDDVMIGGNVKLYSTDFHSLRYDSRIKKIDTDIKSKEILIKKGAFIGGSSIILKGVVIGERAVIGAGSVVTHDIPNDEIWAGNPAVFIRKIKNGSMDK